MKKCCICESSDITDNSDILFINQNGEYKEICRKCSEMMEIAETADNPRKAIFYFEYLLENIKDFEVKNFINDLINNKYNISANSNETEENVSNNSNETIWIKGLKIVAWFLFFGIILTCLILSIIIGDISGALLLIMSFPIAFLCVAGMMIWLDVVSDIREIKNNLKERGN